MSETTWTIPNIIAICTVFAAPISGVIAAWIANKRSNRQTPPPTEPSAESVRRFPETAAHNAELSLIFDGFRASQESLLSEFERVRDAANGCNDRVQEMEEQLKAYHRERSKERGEMISHIVVLESLIPQPPGAPPRPASWVLE